MNTKLVKFEAKKQLNKLQKLLKKASEGKDTGELGSELFIDDVAELIKYYKYVSSGNFKKAGVLQIYTMDTATYELINDKIYDFIQEYGHPVEKEYL